MKKEQWIFKGYGEQPLYAVCWLPEGEVKGVLQVTHGMTEHIDRYEEFAQFMNNQGIAVAGFDLRGHGHHPGNRQVASLGENGWEASLEDMHLFLTCLQKRFEKVPYYLLGFSLGSFLVREYLNRWPENLAGAVIMGTGSQPGLILSVIMKLVQGQIKKAGADNTTAFVRQLSFGTYNQKCKPNRTQADWLCADDAQLDLYLADPLVRADISAGLFFQLLSSMKRTGMAETYTGWNKALPVLLLSGQQDPVGDGGKGVLAVREKMQQAGIFNVTLQLFENSRHDLLHEEKSCAMQAREFVANWILSAR